MGFLMGFSWKDYFRGKGLEGLGRGVVLDLSGRGWIEEEGGGIWRLEKCMKGKTPDQSPTIQDFNTFPS